MFLIALSVFVAVSLRRARGELFKSNKDGSAKYTFTGNTLLSHLLTYKAFNMLNFHEVDFKPVIKQWSDDGRLVRVFELKNLTRRYVLLNQKFSGVTQAQPSNRA